MSIPETTTASATAIDNLAAALESRFGFVGSFILEQTRDGWYVAAVHEPDGARLDESDDEGAWRDAFDGELIDPDTLRPLAYETRSGEMVFAP